MLPTLTLRGTGLLEAAKLAAWKRESFGRLRSATVRAFREQAPKMAAAVRANVQQGLRIRNRAFLSGYRGRVYATRADRLPAMAVGSSVRLSGIHERGGTVVPRGKLLLIPFGPRRIGPKRFRELIRTLMRGGNAYFRQVNGRAILFAENIAEHDRELGRFKRAERARSGAKRLKRGADIPIAVGVTRVELRKRTDVVGTVKRSLPNLVAAVEHEIARNLRGR